MSDLKKIFVGQQIKKFPANTWNKLLAGELRDRDRKNAPDIRSSSQHSPVLVLLRWDGESTVGSGACVKLTSSLFDPTGEEIGATYGLGFACEAFGESDPLDIYAITLGPITGGGDSIGYGFIPEAWWAQVNVTDDAHDHATAAEGTQLTSSTSGLRIIWKQSGTGTKWAVVQLHAQVRIVQGTTTAAALTTNPTFQLENLVAISGKLPDEPLTVQQLFPAGYSSGQSVLAIASSNGDWINTPDTGKVLVNSADKVPDFIYEKIVDKGTFDSDLHQVVYAQAIVDGDARNLKLYTALGAGGSYTAGCGLNISEGEISVDPADLAGDGLVPDGATTCGLKVNVDDCTLKIESDVVAVNLDNIAGCGLQKYVGDPPYDDCKLAIKVDPDGCIECDPETGLKVTLADPGCLECDSGLNVKVDPDGCLECGENGLAVRIKPDALIHCTEDGLAVIIGVGCGLDFTDDTIFFDAPTVAGAGLTVTGACTLAVNAGCGLAIVADQVIVDNTDLAGDGLVPSGTCGLAVGEGCGISVTANAVSVDVESLAGDGLDFVTNCGTSEEPVACCKLKVATNVSIKSIKECELVIEGGALKLKLTYDIVEVYGVVGATDEIDECEVDATNCAGG